MMSPSCLYGVSSKALVLKIIRRLFGSQIGAGASGQRLPGSSFFFFFFRDCDPVVLILTTSKATANNAWAPQGEQGDSFWDPAERRRKGNRSGKGAGDSSGDRAATPSLRRHNYLKWTQVPKNIRSLSNS